LKKIITTFPIFRNYGGAELSATNTLDYFRKHYEVTLLHCGQVNKKLIISDKIIMKKISTNNQLINYLISNYIIFAQFFLNIYLLKKDLSEFKFALSLHGELSTNIKTYQFIHFPFFSLNIRNYFYLGMNFFKIHKIFLRYILTLFINLIFIIKKINFINTTTFCNSNWTKNIYQKIYNKNIIAKIYVIYMTFTLKRKVSENIKKFQKRENNFVILGRLTKDKKVYEAIKIFLKINFYFNNTFKLIIIGGSNDEKYKDKCLRISNESVCFKDYISEEEKISILSNSKFGMHLFQNEHFGIAPCEMQNYGMLVFAYNGGGVKEIINNDRLLFTNYENLKNKIKNLVEKSSELYECHKKMRFQQSKFTNDFYKNLMKIN